MTTYPQVQTTDDSVFVQARRLLAESEIVSAQMVHHIALCRRAVERSRVQIQESIVLRQLSSAQVGGRPPR